MSSVITSFGINSEYQQVKAKINSIESCHDPLNFFLMITDTVKMLNQLYSIVKEKRNMINQIPAVVMLMIFSFLPYSEGGCRTGSVSKAWFRLLKSQASHKML